MLRYELHYEHTTPKRLTRLQVEQRLHLPPGYALQFEKAAKKAGVWAQGYMDRSNALLQKKLQNGTPNVPIMNPWQTLGFFVGDGGIHIVWGFGQVTVTLSFTGDSKSKTALEAYCASLIQDGVYRVAWVSQTRDVSRLYVHGIDLFDSFIVPFFQKYPLPLCEKQAYVQPILKGIQFLAYLKKKLVWDANDIKKLQKFVDATWNLNPHGPGRQFKGTTVEYVQHLENMRQKNKLKLR